MAGQLRRRSYLSSSEHILKTYLRVSTIDLSGTQELFHHIRMSSQEQTAATDHRRANSVEIDASYENDSSYGDELSSYSASLTSSVLDYRLENGRRYHKYRDGAYLLPNDDAENERLDMLHEMFLVLLDRKLYLAPIRNPQRVIDLATGTGLWAIDFADQHPQAEVIGCDLSPTQPTLVPPNVKFLVDDIESDWAYERNPFDFIHARFLAASIKNYGRLIRECYRSVKPGGWVEFQDWDCYPFSEDGSLDGTALQKYQNEINKAFEKAGYEMRPGPKLKEWFKEAGFQNIVVNKYFIPYGVWPKDRHLVSFILCFQ
ncbi:hypothetical protein VTN49DRAFT_5433 [Thermomyces lanuginosus]|uniref:uncharacterized protein n=1 Tax=Thermomyces lanuginosus TaxID=5541 RepID=UPI0037422C3E